MHIHILGICGTFMGSLAVLARELGHTVTGSDQGVYPPMSTQLEAQGISLMEGFSPDHLEPKPDLVLIGNAMSRGNPEVEAVLNRNIDYMSGPEWLSREVLRHRWVMAVAGTHGKTTTTSMLLWILDQAGFEPGYLVGGVPRDFPVSARLGNSDFFVIEADEYDSAFFDKRSKFVHYRPHTLILNNLEFDHADIFADLPAIQQQFHHLLRTVPASGTVVVNGTDERLEGVLEMGCWSQVQTFGAAQQWQADPLSRDCSEFTVLNQGETVATVKSALFGEHNMANTLAAIAAAASIGIEPAEAATAMTDFVNAQRRLEESYRNANTVVYDDFAHHPTAIRLTVSALRSRVQNQRILAVVDLSSNTMRLGTHEKTLAAALAGADEVILHAGGDIHWDPKTVISALSVPAVLTRDVDETLNRIKSRLKPGDQVLIMSNGGFGNIHQLLANTLAAQQ
jgi:UDP-N-acetylmuramate: L-alanyl-gamma-D-glutamyl-meso-diaminopimelate ligase